MAEFEGTARNFSAESSEADPKPEHSVGEGNNDIGEEMAARSREGDLRAELSRRRAERLTKVSLYNLRGGGALSYKSYEQPFSIVELY